LKKILDKHDWQVYTIYGKEYIEGDERGGAGGGGFYDGDWSGSICSGWGIGG
jgi:hypothetical protein